jgi:hypothetical protein
MFEEIQHIGDRTAAESDAADFTARQDQVVAISQEVMREQAVTQTRFENEAALSRLDMVAEQLAVPEVVSHMAEAVRRIPDYEDLDANVQTLRWLAHPPAMVTDKAQIAPGVQAIHAWRIDWRTAEGAEQAGAPPDMAVALFTSRSEDAALSGPVRLAVVPMRQPGSGVIDERLDTLLTADSMVPLLVRQYSELIRTEDYANLTNRQRADVIAHAEALKTVAFGSGELDLLETGMGAVPDLVRKRLDEIGWVTEPDADDKSPLILRGAYDEATRHLEVAEQVVRGEFYGFGRLKPTPTHHLDPRSLPARGEGEPPVYESARLAKINQLFDVATMTTGRRWLRVVQIETPGGAVGHHSWPVENYDPAAMHNQREVVAKRLERLFLAYQNATG